MICINQIIANEVPFAAACSPLLLSPRLFQALGQSLISTLSRATHNWTNENKILGREQPSPTQPDVANGSPRKPKAKGAERHSGLKGGFDVADSIRHGHLSTAHRKPFCGPHRSPVRSLSSVPPAFPINPGRSSVLEPALNPDGVREFGFGKLVA